MHTDAEWERIQSYREGGASYVEACVLAGIKPNGDDAGSYDAGYDDLIVENGSLAVRAIHKALTSGKIDNTIMTAAVRAVQMLQEHQKAGKGTDPEDDMLAWVAERKQEELNGE